MVTWYFGQFTDQMVIVEKTATSLSTLLIVTFKEEQPIRIFTIDVEKLI